MSLTYIRFLLYCLVQSRLFVSIAFVIITLIFILLIVMLRKTLETKKPLNVSAEKCKE